MSQARDAANWHKWKPVLAALIAALQAETDHARAWAERRSTDCVDEALRVAWVRRLETRDRLVTELQKAAEAAGPDLDGLAFTSADSPAETTPPERAT